MSARASPSPYHSSISLTYGFAFGHSVGTCFGILKGFVEHENK